MSAHQRPVASKSAPERPDPTSEAGARDSGAQGRWELWFPRRYGPLRKRTTTVDGLKIEFKARTLEFPPGPNGSRGNPFAHNTWVQEWRQEAVKAAWAHRIPACERIRISAVFHRTRCGQADEDNDRSRLKPLVDGLRDAGVIKRDTRKYVTYGDCTEVKAKQGACGILLIVEAA